MDEEMKLSLKEGGGRGLIIRRIEERNPRTNPHASGSWSVGGGG